MLKSRYTYMILGFIILFFGILNGGLLADGKNSILSGGLFSDTLDLHLLSHKTASIFVIVGGLMYVVCVYLEIINKSESPINLQKLSDNLQKQREKSQFKNNQKKWREHYTKLKIKRGL